jgi:hypothetical protein
VSHCVTRNGRNAIGRRATAFTTQPSCSFERKHRISDEVIASDRFPTFPDKSAATDDGLPRWNHLNGKAALYPDMGTLFPRCSSMEENDNTDETHRASWNETIKLWIPPFAFAHGRSTANSLPCGVAKWMI